MLFFRNLNTSLFVYGNLIFFRPITLFIIKITNIFIIFYRYTQVKIIILMYPVYSLGPYLIPKVSIKYKYTRANNFHKPHTS